MIRSHIAIVLAFFLGMTGPVRAQGLRQVSSLPAQALVTIEEQRITQSSAGQGELQFKLFRFYDYSITAGCRGEYCPRVRFYVVAYRRGELPTYAVLRSPAAFAWRNLRVSGTTGANNDVTIRVIGERDVQGRDRFIRAILTARVNIP